MVAMNAIPMDGLGGAKHERASRYPWSQLVDTDFAFEEVNEALEQSERPEVRRASIVDAGCRVGRVTEPAILSRGWRYRSAARQEGDMASTEQSVVKETPGVCGGYPCIGDTRIPVRLIVEFTRDGLDIDAILAIYPQLSREQVRGALDYYKAHPARVDEDIARNARSWMELQGRGWPV